MIDDKFQKAIDKYLKICYNGIAERSQQSTLQNLRR